MFRVVTRLRSWWQTLREDHGPFIDKVPFKWTTLAIFVASALTLYVEMVMVRWHATCFHAFAIFKNVSLLSCFLGLGIGYAMSRKPMYLATFLPLLALQTALFSLLSIAGLGGLRMNPVAEQLVMGNRGAEWWWFHAIQGNAFLAFVFVLNAVMFIPLGQLAGRLMVRLPKVQSYSLNLLGSLTGIGVFFVLSLLWTPPAVWMALAVLAIAPFTLLLPSTVAIGGVRNRLAAVGIGSTAVILLALGLANKPFEQKYYSPYQIITLRLPRPQDEAAVPTIKVNHSFFQNIYDCNEANIARHPRLKQIAAYYNLPYELQREPGDVCVVGAGSGNDVAAALRHGATSVTAVEIDPTIVKLGTRLHPERPFQDQRTRTVVNDARTFLRNTDEQFDTVVYGLLDSHTNLGAMTNVRLDSFVYTVEGFQEAVHRLNDDGLLIVSYLVLDPLQGDKLYAMLHEAYADAPPRAFLGPCGTTFVTGPGLARVTNTMAGGNEVTDRFLARSDNTEVATDDWPFFYMQQRCYPVTYAVMIGVLLVLSVCMVGRYLGIPKVSPSPQGVFFFLGAGFMLIETKAVTELGLVFGNTWSVIAVVITSILVLAFLANLWVMRRGPVANYISFPLLGLALGLGLWLSQLSMEGVVIPAARLVVPLVLTLPLLFAGLVFSSELARRGQIGDALFANLLGAMLGGFLEYNSMYWGFSSLYPLGMGLYGLAFVCSLFKSRTEETEPVEEYQLLKQKVAVDMPVGRSTQLAERQVHQSTELVDS